MTLFYRGNASVIFSNGFCRDLIFTLGLREFMHLFLYLCLREGISVNSSSVP